MAKVNRLLGTVNGGEGEANARLEKLQQAFPDNEFEVRPHDGRHQLFVKDFDPSLGEVGYTDMRQVAGAHITVPIEEKNEIRTSTAPSEGMDGGEGDGPSNKNLNDPGLDPDAERDAGRYGDQPGEMSGRAESARTA